MKNHKLIVLFFILLSFLEYNAQDTIFIATARLNKNTIAYSKAVSTYIEFIDFMNVPSEQRNSLLNKCSGLLLLGGLDIHPSRYNKGELAKFCDIDIKRDSIELSLLTWADSSTIPILGICRGMQFINVYFGGTLCVDIPSFCMPSTKNEQHRDSKRKKDVYHSVIISENTRLSECFVSKKTVTVNSFHHQCVGEIGKSLKISAKSPGGIIEGIENDPSKRTSFVLGVQWHPERYYMQDPDNLKILEKFINAIKLKNKY